MSWLWIFLGGGIGSLLRYGISLVAGTWFKTAFPVGTFLANILACMIIAVTMVIFQRNLRPEWATQLVIIGFCGGLSTFSTFSNDNLQLIQQGNLSLALINIGLSVLSGIAVIWLIASNRS